ncbi:hypothetical protein FA95DRAFT_1563211 [Auriscalpium vulgare]|uniref:Uncharacterized protein n=1 Tax=Auriscalpium vulgare TaxID=40419 RepID=A0ACB8RHE2_9AGAM|nr:hypothetical protein FA95DRAFT_1563211 [Auriscalpium vulgare]
MLILYKCSPAFTDLQRQGTLQMLSYAVTENPQAVNRWTVVVRISGVVMGSFSAPLRATAKEEAARQALVQLGVI